MKENLNKEFILKISELEQEVETKNIQIQSKNKTIQNLTSRIYELQHSAENLPPNECTVQNSAKLENENKALSQTIRLLTQKQRKFDQISQSKNLYREKFEQLSVEHSDLKFETERQQNQLAGYVNLEQRYQKLIEERAHQTQLIQELAHDNNVLKKESAEIQKNLQDCYSLAQAEVRQLQENLKIEQQKWNDLRSSYDMLMKIDKDDTPMKKLPKARTPPIQSPEPTRSPQLSPVGTANPRGRFGVAIKTRKSSRSPTTSSTYLPFFMRNQRKVHRRSP